MLFSYTLLHLQGSFYRHVSNLSLLMKRSWKLQTTVTVSLREMIKTHRLFLKCYLMYDTSNHYLYLCPAILQLISKKLHSAVILLRHGMLHCVIYPDDFLIRGCSRPVPGHLQVILRMRRFGVKLAAHHDISSIL